MKPTKDTLTRQLESLERKAANRIGKAKKNRAIKSREQLIASIFGITINEVSAVSARGTNILYVPKSKTCSGVSHQTIAESDREAFGLSTRMENVSYGIHMVDGTEVKRCLCCNDTFPLTNFSKATKQMDGYMGSCKDCDSKRKKAYGVLNAQMRIEDIGLKVEKVCGCCKAKKPITAFAAAYTSFRGSSKTCKECVYESVKAQKAKKEFA